MAFSRDKFDITYITQKPTKRQAITDHLAENPVEDYKLMAGFFLNECIMNIEVEKERRGSERPRKWIQWRTYFLGSCSLFGIHKS